ncbi:methyltransferase [Nonomuraea sp. NPDC049400]|uniref:methyltransferase n=1 Tax=Nonomuraea sp. NPDC049400 TaxID=3364352 RepID=UPI0037B23AE3
MSHPETTPPSHPAHPHKLHSIATGPAPQVAAPSAINDSPSWLSKLRLFITCGGAEALAMQGPMTSDDLAAWCGATQTVMAITLNILRHHKIVVLEDGHFRLGTLGPARVAALTSFTQAEMLPPARRGSSHHAPISTQHTHLASAPTPQAPLYSPRLAEFGDTIAAAIGRDLACLGADHIASAHTVAQVGGGQGELLAAVLAAHPHLQGTLVVWPGADSRAKEYLAAQRLQHRVKLTAAHLPTQAPPADRFILARLLRHLPGQQCLRLLAAVCASLLGSSGDSQLWYIDGPLPAPQPPCVDLGEPGMRIWDSLLTGLDRSSEDLRTLMEQAGLRLHEERSLSHGQHLMIAVPASRHSSP